MIKVDGNPGIYQRGSRFVATWRDADGQLRKASAATVNEAVALKVAGEKQARAGVEHVGAKPITLRDYALGTAERAPWIERYHPRGGLRDHVRRDHQRILEQHILPAFPARLKLAALTTARVQTLIGKLMEKGLSDKSIRNYVGVLSAMLDWARRIDKLITTNPCADAELPDRDEIEEVSEHEDGDEDDAGVLTEKQIVDFLENVHPKHRALFETLAETAIRVSEAVGLEWRHVQLDRAEPRILIRQACVKGGKPTPPKSKHSKRDIYITDELAAILRAHKAASPRTGPKHPVFPNEVGKRPNIENIRNRHLRPVMAEIGCKWAGYHTFRHSRLSTLLRAGYNIKQVQLRAGHHSAAFTLSKYIHAIPGDEPVLMPVRGNGGGNRGGNTPRTTVGPDEPLTVESMGFLDATAPQDTA